MVYLGIAAALVVAAYFGWRLTARSSYESAAYTVLESEGPFQTREYPDLMLATTGTPAGSQAEDGGFMRLFRYIDGANQDAEKIAMTTPVFMEPAADDAPGQMGFVLPKQVSEQRIPAPSGKGVQIERRPGGRFAVVRFAGRMKTDSAAKAEEDLRAWMAQKGLVGSGAAERAGYDPPWTPGPLRRNEVLIRLQ
ncbi:SOUL heme-binding protein [Pirellulimonas nuda]|uniref:SOUL heme-binding protein n=2 Tax=Pirellulimonas nuda TaxID=2528009 RepID=A0A518DCN3_9BACT|nr:SOUL heme-binding protein [Pirellulimonas nuda]